MFCKLERVRLEESGILLETGLLLESIRYLHQIGGFAESQVTAPEKASSLECVLINCDLFTNFFKMTLQLSPSLIPSCRYVQGFLVHMIQANS